MTPKPKCSVCGWWITENGNCRCNIENKSKQKFVWLVRICYESDLGVYSTKKRAQKALKDYQDEEGFISEGDRIDKWEIDTGRWIYEK